jgi:hypothetical protein
MKKITTFKDFICESQVNVCAKVCKECPFSKNSIPGWLADYTTGDFKDFMNNEVLFPCHMMMSEESLSHEEVQDKIQNGELKLCRGYVESVIKSAKSPRYNQTLKDAMVKARAEGLSDETMPIWDFIKHHEQFKK